MIPSGFLNPRVITFDVSSTLTEVYSKRTLGVHSPLLVKVRLSTS